MLPRLGCQARTDLECTGLRGISDSFSFRPDQQCHTCQPSVCCARAGVLVCHTQCWSLCQTRQNCPSNAAPEHTLLRGISDRLGPSAPRKRRTGRCRRGDSLSTLCHTHHTRSRSPAQPERPILSGQHRQQMTAPIHGCTQHISSSSTAQPKRPALSEAQQQHPGTALMAAD